MNDSLDAILGRNANRPLLIDTNVLLLYVVGSYDRSLLVNFGRTKSFGGGDFDSLMGVIARVAGVATTPHVLTETSNFLGHLREPVRTELFQTTFADFIDQAGEHFIDAKRLVASESNESERAFFSIGLTDAAILALKQKVLIMTIDAKLTSFLFSANVDFINFNHLRSQGW